MIDTINIYFQSIVFYSIFSWLTNYNKTALFNVTQVQQILHNYNTY